MKLVMYHTLVPQQLLAPNVQLVALKKINVTQCQIHNVDQTNIGLSVITVLKTTVNGEWPALKSAKMTGLNAA